MLKQLLLDELNRLQNTHERVEEKSVYVESIQKLLRELTANRSKLGREFEIQQIHKEIASKKNVEGTDDMANFVEPRLSSALLCETTWH